MRERLKKTENAMRALFLAFIVISLAAALIAPDRAQMFEGLKRICTQSGQVVKSYFDPSYGGVSGTFLNVALVCLACLLIYCLPGAKPDGLSALAFFLTAGFCFWGTTILNIWFSIAGVVLYALVKKKSLGSLSNAMLFSTGIGPLITEMLFRYPYLEGTEWGTITFSGFLIALAVGVFIGFMLPAGLGHSPNMHLGFDLYSAAVPIGLTAFFLRALLYKNFVPDVPAAQGVGLADTSNTLTCYLFCAVVFGLAILVGLLLGGGKKYAALIKDSGYGVDYTAKYGFGATLLNLGVYGLFIVLYYTAIGATWNAATIGVTFCMVACFAKGSHPRNVWPIMVGYVAASFLTKGVCALTGANFTLAINAQAIVIGLCFANGLSPIAGKYGWPFGIAFGMIHYFLVTSVPLMHGAFCLYNGGFTAGLSCMLFMPVVQNFFKPLEERKAA